MITLATAIVAMGIAGLIISYTLDFSLDKNQTLPEKETPAF